MTYDLRLVVYAPNDIRLGWLPNPLSFDAGWPLNDVPSLKLDYSTHAVGADLLDDPCEIAVEYSTGDSWTEPPNSRFLRIKRSGDSIDDNGSRSYDCPGYAWQFRKCVLYPNNAMVEGKRPFNAVTPGAIIATFINEAQARGTLSGVSVDFDPDFDSDGQSWSHLMTIQLDPGMDLLTLLINLSDQGVIDWQVQGRTLQVFNEGSTMAADLASGPSPVDLRFGRDVTEAPDDATLEDAASAILIAGEDGLSVEVTNPSATAPWGRWEAYQSQGGVSDTGTAMLLGQAALDRASGERVQITRGVVFDTARWLPWNDYATGCTVLAPGDGGVMDALRVRQITLSRNSEGEIAGNITLNDRFLELDIKLARKSEGILNGGVTSGGSGGTPAPDTSGRVPAAPEGLIIEPDAYLSKNGWAEGQITATWGAVTADVNGVAINVDSYELYARLNVSGEVWGQITATAGNDTNATYSPLRVNTEYAFKVRATADGAKGAFSSEYVVTIPGDVTPPGIPTTPTLSTRLGIIYVTWDGMAEGPVAMPIDFDHVTVWMSTDGSTYQAVGTLRKAGSLVVAGQPYNTDRSFRLTAVDRAGNESDPSDDVTIATKPLVDTDVIGQVIDGANIVDGSISAVDKVIANTITGDLIQANAIEAGHLSANSVTADSIEAGAVTAAALSADAIDGKTITGAWIRTAEDGQRLELAPPDASVPEMRFYPSASGNYTVLQTRDDITAGEATLIITSSQDAAASYRAQLQMGATLTRINVMDEDASSPKGGRMDVASTYGRYGYYSGSASTETYIHTDSTGIYYIRGKFLDEAQLDAYDALSVGTTTIGGSGGTINYMWILYPSTMASLMGVVCTVRDGGSGNSKDNTYTPKAWSCTWNSTGGFQINLAAANSFELSWWNHRH